MKFKPGDLVYRSGIGYTPDPGAHTAGIGIIIGAFISDLPDSPGATRVLWLNTGKKMVSYNSLLSALRDHPINRRNKNE